MLSYRCFKFICHYHNKSRIQQKTCTRTHACTYTHTINVISCISQNYAATNKLCGRNFNKLECYSFMQAILDWFKASLKSSRKQDDFVFLFHHQLCLPSSRLLHGSKITAGTSAFPVVADEEKENSKGNLLKMCWSHMSSRRM